MFCQAVGKSNCEAFWAKSGSSVWSTDGQGFFHQNLSRQCGWYTLQGINISHLGKRKIIFKMPFLGDMLVSWRVFVTSGAVEEVQKLPKIDSFPPYSTWQIGDACDVIQLSFLFPPPPNSPTGRKKMVIDGKFLASSWFRGLIRGWWNCPYAWRIKHCKYAIRL